MIGHRVPIGYTMGHPTFTLKIALFRDRSLPLSNTFIPLPTPFSVQRFGRTYQCDKHRQAQTTLHHQYPAKWHSSSADSAGYSNSQQSMQADEIYQF